MVQDTPPDIFPPSRNDPLRSHKRNKTAEVPGIDLSKVNRVEHFNTQRQNLWKPESIFDQPDITHLKSISKNFNYIPDIDFDKPSIQK